MILWALDYEMLVTVCVAVAGVCIVVLESRAHRRETDERIALHERLAYLETCVAALNDKVELAQRITALEARPRARRQQSK
jgi:hypothetical protein